MKWLKNLENIAEKKMSGMCPFCHSENTDYTFIGETSKIGYGDIWCNDCKRAYHISRLRVTAGYNINKPIPQNLNYN